MSENDMNMTCELSMHEPANDDIVELLNTSKVVAMVGLSPNEGRDSNRVAHYLLDAGYDVIPVNQSVEQPESLAVPSQVVEHFIRKAAFHWVMDFCICRDSAHCKDYPVEYGCIFLGTAASDINPRFGRPVTMAQALDHARRCRESGVHIRGAGVWRETS